MTMPLAARPTYRTASDASSTPSLAEGASASAASPDAGSTARFFLRERTRQQHEATEEAFAPFDLGDPAHYRAFLTAHAMVLPRIELAVTGRGWPRFHPRLPRVADDLAAMGAWLPVPMIAPTISEAGIWGVQYVLEGSKLGGRVLASRLAEGSPARYLTPDPDMSASWQDFCAAFDAAANDATLDWLDEAASAAVETFQCFRRAANAMAEDLK
ncbi:biliverdin-producing heme oxygenase [Croceicoccus mobilis]|uniref:Heme oxygenase n=1 Tax=Croceicoccus mobilis TaxID=1703339 RepID=A0A917DVM3_9SPHN|nr:biliverdin-producing heme oxygenase [Croceicoccus mobilis]GGD71174.1 hypothetical protein GCM10010990_20830 [Croceicoccus mobilis]